MSAVTKPCCPQIMFCYKIKCQCYWFVVKLSPRESGVKVHDRVSRKGKMVNTGICVRSEEASHCLVTSWCRGLREAPQGVAL